MRDVKIISLPPPKLEPHKGRYRLIAPYDFIIEVDGYQRVFTIPAGFETDGGSVPRIGWRVAGQPCDPRYIAAFLVHDWIYATHALDRDVADAVLYHAMRKEGASWTKARMYFYAVRLCGVSHWETKTKGKNYGGLYCKNTEDAQTVNDSRRRSAGRLAGPSLDGEELRGQE